MKRRSSKGKLGMTAVFFAATFLMLLIDAAAQQQRQIPAHMMAENILDLDTTQLKRKSI